MIRVCAAISVLLIAIPGCSCSRQPEQTTKSTTSGPERELSSKDANAAPGESQDEQPAKDNSSGPSPPIPVSSAQSDAGSAPTLTRADTGSEKSNVDRRAADAASARKNAERLMSRAAAADGRADTRQAFAATLEAWQEVRKYAEADEQCRELATRLLADLKNYGEAASDSDEEAARSKPIEVK